MKSCNHRQLLSKEGSSPGDAEIQGASDQSAQLLPVCTFQSTALIKRTYKEEESARQKWNVSTPLSGCCGRAVASSWAFSLPRYSLSLLLPSTPVRSRPMRCWYHLWGPVFICGVGGVGGRRILFKQLTAPLHPIVLLSAHGFCVHVHKSRKDGLPACCSMQAIVFRWTVCHWAVMLWEPDSRDIVKVRGVKNYSDSNIYTLF